MRSSIGECNCKALDVLAGEFRGCVKESNVRYIIGEYNCKALDALAGEFRGCVRESNVRYRDFNRKLREIRDFNKKVKRK